MGAVETKTYRGYTIKIYQDEMAESPRIEWDNMGTMVLFHSRYELGDKEHGYNSQDFKSFDELKIQILRDHRDCVILPVYMYDHSGITINTTGFHCPWDSGQVGFIFISLEKARKEYQWLAVTKKRRDFLEVMLRSEVSLYDSFLRGEVYGYKVVSPKGEDLDSCWGFYGGYEESGLMDEARGNIDWAINEKRKAHYKKLKAWIRNKVNVMYREPLGAL